MLLAPDLYDLLSERLGAVHVANPGTDREEYAVACPFCGDHGRHLYLNHRYGAYDPDEGADNLHLAYCFRYDCLSDPENRRALRERVFGFLNVDVRRRLRPAPPPRAPCGGAATLAYAPPPGQLARLSALPGDHPALAYLRGRGYDPAELEALHGVALCTRAAPRYARAQGRLILPVTRDGRRVGWQARAPYDADWKALRAPKYYSMPGMPRGHVLYNLDAAKEHPFPVLTEGATKVWAVGPQGVGLLGKTLAGGQMELLVRHWRGRPAVVLLDADDPDARGPKTDRLAGQLQDLLRARPVAVRLPEGIDPGDAPRELLWRWIALEAEAQGVQLPETPWHCPRAPAAAPAAADAGARRVLLG